MNWIKHLFRKEKPEAARPGVPDELPPVTLRALVRMLAHTQPGELDCDEVHDLLGQFAELAQSGENTAALLPLVDQHLNLCGECREEYEALLRVLQAHAEV